jgi:hypothetical protein
LLEAWISAFAEMPAVVGRCCGLASAQRHFAERTLTPTSSLSP